ncbi:MAG: hypothetical protein ACI4QT_03810 [Kiritimatiellia bacterium]
MDWLLTKSVDNEILWFENNFSEEIDAVTQVMKEVFPALLESGMTPADVLVWSCDLTRLFECYETYFEISPDPWDAPGTEYAKQEVWLETARRLTGELDALPGGEDDGDTFDICNHRLPYIRKAYRLAGCEECAIPVYRKYVAKANLWEEAIDLALACGKTDIAIDFGRRGFREMDPNCYSEKYMLLARVAEIFADKGELTHATAILAEVFLSWGGVYLENRTVDSFQRIIELSAKIGVEKEVRASLVYALETGENPLPLLYDCRSEAPKQEYSWPSMLKTVVYRPPWTSLEPPIWPLPPSNEGICLDKSRWTSMSKSACQSDQEFLVKLALFEGDKPEVARRFCALPSFPCIDDPYQGLAAKDLVASVRLRMVCFRPDIVEIIDKPELHWKWRKH